MPRQAKDYPYFVNGMWKDPRGVWEVIFGIEPENCAAVRFWVSQEQADIDRAAREAAKEPRKGIRQENEEQDERVRRTRELNKAWSEERDAACREDA